MFRHVVARSPSPHLIHKQVRQFRFFIKKDFMRAVNNTVCVGNKIFHNNKQKKHPARLRKKIRERKLNKTKTGGLGW